MSFDCLEKMLDHYDALLEYERSLWVRVSDRLPDDGITVLVSVPECESEPVWTAFYSEDRWFWEDNMTIKGTVTHWRHFPAPPRA